MIEPEFSEQQLQALQSIINRGEQIESLEKPERLREANKLFDEAIRVLSPITILRVLANYHNREIKWK